MNQSTLSQPNSNSFMIKKNWISSNLKHIWFARFVKHYENNPMNTISLRLIKYRNLCFISHFLRSIVTVLLISNIYFFLKQKAIFLAFFIDFIIISIGFTNALLISYKFTQIHNILVSANFIFKIVVVWYNLIQNLILSAIFLWRSEILELFILQFIFLINDILPNFTIFSMFQYEILLCQSEKKYLLTV